MIDWIQKLQVWMERKVVIHKNTLFIEWIEDRDKKIFSQWEIWWCVLGQNIGTEIYGKWEDFSRPILILKKTGKYGFIWLPSTTKYENIRNKNMISKVFETEKEVFSVFRFDQVRMFDSIRLQEKLRDISDTELSEVQEKFYTYLIQKNAPVSTRDTGIG